MPHTLSDGQIQTLLQYLYSQRVDVRMDAIRHTVAYKWDDAQLIEALTELAALDPVKDVRLAARKALGELEESAA